MSGRRPRFLQLTEAWNALHCQQRNQTKSSSSNKRYAVIDHPERSADCRHHHGGNVVDGEADRHTRSDILGIGNLLEISANGNSKIEQDMIEDIHRDHNQLRAAESIDQKDTDQAGILKGKHLAFAKADNSPADEGTQYVVDGVIGDEQQGDLGHCALEHLHQQVVRSSQF